MLARELSAYANKPDTIVLALPRGGVPVAAEVAGALGLPMDVFVVRKLGVPGQEELAMGAVASGGVRVLNEEILAELGLPDETIDAITARQLEEVRRRENLYRGGTTPAGEVRGKTVLVVDDGLATGSTMRAAVKALRQMQAKRIVVAVPTGAPDTCELLRREADEVVCLMAPEPYFAVGAWYADFSQTSDDEVRRLMAGRRRPTVAGAQ